MKHLIKYIKGLIYRSFYIRWLFFQSYDKYTKKKIKMGTLKVASNTGMLNSTAQRERDSRKNFDFPTLSRLAYIQMFICIYRRICR